MNHRDTVRLPGYDLWMTFVRNVHVIPLILNVSMFRDALSNTVKIYPHVAGRLRNLPDGQWEIDLVGAAIPLYVESTSHIHLQHWVVQDHENLGSFLCPPLPATAVVNEDLALLQFKLTMSENGDTAIGVSWHHALGDLTLLHRFMNTISRIYEGLEPSFPTPTFTKQHFPVPDAETLAKYSSFCPYLVHSLSGSKYGETQRTISRVDWRVSRRELESLRGAVQLMIPALKVSLQDCLTAYVVTVINQHRPFSIKKVTNAASYREIKAPFVQPDVAGNAILIIPTEEDFRGGANIVEVAKKIRESLLHNLEARRLEQSMSVISYLMLLAANEHRPPFFGIETTTLSINSNIRLDWASVAFGYGGLARFYTCGYSRFYLRTFSSNPGVHEASFDVSFGVPDDMKARVIQTLQSDFGNLEFPRNIIGSL
ncbi:hypothetical protein D9615_001725 [Tricholomella constricta]|uniref:Uncharacterized protein n=1 Tax=Tricholomella constricta TaxID=117010 RepID=A0A8H5HNF5_9AGAR|nr:hypothetical protein D9615_001725 [Tricholomella constricta]